MNSDALATAQLMGEATDRIQVGTWIANVYLRHPYACAQAAALIADATGGRFVLGLGVSHGPVNAALGIDMEDPVAYVRRYVSEVQTWLRGEGPATHLPQRPTSQPVPVYVSALSSRTIEQAAELADGVMPTFFTPERVEQSAAWAARGQQGASSPERSAAPSCGGSS